MTSEAPSVTGLALQVKDLRVSYGPKRAVDGVSLDINEGEIFGLLGPNGAGKTSTLSAIEGLLKPTSGSILIRQVDARAHPGLAKALIGVQLQSTSFQSELKISEIVKLYAGLYGVPLTKPAIFDRLTEIHLGDEASRRFSQLSGGQQKRLSLLIATVHDPPLVLLDEPTSGLDPQARRPGVRCSTPYRRREGRAPASDQRACLPRAEKTKRHQSETQPARKSDHGADRSLGHDGNEPRLDGPAKDRRAG